MVNFVSGHEVCELVGGEERRLTLRCFAGPGAGTRVAAIANKRSGVMASSSNLPVKAFERDV